MRCRQIGERQIDQAFRIAAVIFQRLFNLSNHPQDVTIQGDGFVLCDPVEIVCVILHLIEDSASFLLTSFFSAARRAACTLSCNDIRASSPT